MNPSASARQMVVSVGADVGLPRAGGKRPGRVRRRWVMMWSTTAWSVMKLKMRVRQAKPGSTGKEVADATLKVEVGAQWVKVPPGQSLASRPVASLACSGGVIRPTKRRQRASKPRDRAPKVSVLSGRRRLHSREAASIRPVRRGRVGRPGSESGACLREGLPKEPGRPCRLRANNRSSTCVRGNEAREEGRQGVGAL